MIRFTLVFVAGVLLFQYQPRLPHPALFAGYSLLLAAAVPLRWCRLPAWLALGFAWAHGHALLTRPSALPFTDTQAPVLAEGRIVSLVDTDSHRSRFIFEADRLQHDGVSYRGHWRLRLSWYRGVPKLLPDDLWQLSVRLRPVHGYANPGGFDYARWLYGEGIRYQGTVLDASENGRLDVSEGAGVARLRQRISEAIAGAVTGAGRSAAALLRALVVGDRSGFSQSDWRLFRATGTNHLVAISGLHVGLVAALVMGLVSLVWRRSQYLCSRWPARSAGALAGWFSALGYAALAGFAIPTQRALLMLTVGLLMLLLSRQQRLGDALAAALLAVVCWSPMAVGSAGLWLSFTAVAVLFWAVADERQRGGQWLLRWGRAQLAISIGLLPLLLAWFQQASLIAPVVNLVAIPVFSLLLVPLALLATLLWLAWPSAGEAGWHLAAWVSDGVLTVLHGLADTPGASLAFATPSPLVLFLAVCAAAILFAPRAVPSRWLAVLLFMPLLANRAAVPAPGAFRFTLLDVGQGLSMVVHTRSHVLVYDAGPRYRSGFNTGDAVVAPYLRRLGVQHIDRLVISHSDIDHAGGLPALLRDFSVGQLLEGEVERGSPCRAGQHWSWDGVRFEMLHPSGDSLTGNNASCVLRVSNAGGSVLITGDIEALSERQLADHDLLEPTTVVVVPHHGSRTSSTAAFIAGTHPDYVLYAVGHDNRWGFPKPDVMARWQAIGASRWDTAVDGAVQLDFPAEIGPVRVHGSRRRHYWNP